MLKMIRSMTLVAIFLAIQLPSAMAVTFGIFGDINYVNNTKQGTSDAFGIGGLGFYATQQISDTTRSFIDFVFEGTGSNTIVIDLERLWISRTFDDRLVLAAGRFHSPLGRWNRTYHHGAMLQDTITRPFFMEYEDRGNGILPLHVNGIMANGTFYLDHAELLYELAVGNGTSLDTSTAGFSPTLSNKPTINTALDPDRGKAVFLRLSYHSDDNALQAGISFMNGDVAESDGTGSAVASKGAAIVSQTLVGLDLGYKLGQFDIAAEYYRISDLNRVGVAGRYQSDSYYVQTGYQINGKWKIIARYEYLRFDNNDSYFRVLATEAGDHNVVGLRYDIDDTNVIKAEFHIEKLLNSSATSAFYLQWAFLVP